MALYIHVKKNHNLTVEQYEKEYGSVYAENALKNISERNKNTQRKSNYRNKLRAENKIDELNNFNKNVGIKVSETIMNSNELRSIRSETLSKLNKTEKFRKKASETAKKTSKREGVLDKRTQQLKDWRENNPEKFSKILSKLHSRYQSKPEKELFDLIKNLFPYLNFKRNQQLFNEKFISNKTKRKQIDILSKNNKIIIEFDGKLHFENIKNWNQLNDYKKRDQELNSLSDEFCIIRISYDQYSYRKIDSGFKQECVDKISQIINNNEPGLNLIGEAYA